MMLCTYCNTQRPANTAPCPRCGAPSPLVSRPTNENGASSSTGWPGSAGALPPGGPSWNVQSLTGTQQQNDAPLWAQVMAPELMQPQQPFPQQPFPGQEQSPSSLPVPYQQPQPPPMQSLMVMPPNAGMMPMPSQGTSALVPVIPGEEGASVYIPPMYTKPRSIIPRYRAISGLLSVLIVFTLLCSATAYYAKANGKLSFLHQLIGDRSPASQPMQPGATLPDPRPEENGPAYTSHIIPSATTASKIDTTTAIPLQATRVFTPGEIIYLTYSVHTTTPGTVNIKWYTNNILYKPQVIPVNPDAQHSTFNGYLTMQFPQTLEGKVELYWNDGKTADQLAWRIYFVVR
ncbi:MAG: hypothetical protein M3Z08_05190 [Chloroflexota bacterium]|nr:hypothetical protein [Chloroflexota bacterium]